jgi:hypothetical protein
MNDHLAVRRKVTAMSAPVVLRGLTHAIGVGLAVVGIIAQPAAVLGGVMVGVFVGGGMALKLSERPGVDVPTRRRAVIRAGGAALWAWLVGTGLLVVLGPSIPSALLALVLIGVPVAFHVRRKRRLPPGPVPPPAAGPAPVLGTLSTPELCLAWRRSYLTLVDLPAGAARSELVTVRQSMLDEFERRDTAGFHRWLDDGARASGDPGRYLATDTGG